METTGRKGFTLLELLIVVIVIGILAGFALPQFGKITNKARAAEAKNMLGAIMTGELMYYQEHQKFTAVASRLDVDFPAADTTNWDYALTGTEGATASTTMTATGNAGAGGYDGKVMTGTLTNAGKRTFSDPV